MWRKPYQGRHDDSLSKVNDNNILVYIQLLSAKVKEYETLGSKEETYGLISYQENE